MHLLYHVEIGISVVVNVTNVVCRGQSQGRIDLIASGGTGGLTFSVRSSLSLSLSLAFSLFHPFISYFRYSFSSTTLLLPQ